MIGKWRCMVMIMYAGDHCLKYVRYHGMVIEMILAEPLNFCYMLK